MLRPWVVASYRISLPELDLDQTAKSIDNTCAHSRSGHQQPGNRKSSSRSRSSGIQRLRGRGNCGICDGDEDLRRQQQRQIPGRTPESTQSTTPAEYRTRQERQERQERQHSTTAINESEYTYCIKLSDTYSEYD